MQTTLVAEYKNLVSKIPDIIEASGYRNDFIAKKMGMKPQNFSAKKQRSTWSIEEIEKLLLIITNEDSDDFIDTILFKSKLTDRKVSSDEFEAELKWK
jgi:hypothetical protein